MDSGSCSQISASWKLDYCQLYNDNVPQKSHGSVWNNPDPVNLPRVFFPLARVSQLKSRRNQLNWANPEDQTHAVHKCFLYWKYVKQNCMTSIEKIIDNQGIQQNTTGALGFKGWKPDES